MKGLWRRIPRWIKYPLFGIFGLISPVIAYVLLSVVFSNIHVNRDFQQEEGVEIHVWSSGVHTDFVLPVKTPEIDWRERFPFHQFRNPDRQTTHVSFGWGDRGFYLETPEWEDLKLETGFNALFLPSPTVVRVEYLRPPVIGGEWKTLSISREQYKKLVEFIESSHRTDDTGKPIRISAGYGRNDAFYEGEGTYDLIDTCNEWTGRGLRRIGARTGLWTPFAGNVMSSLR